MGPMRRCVLYQIVILLLFHEFVIAQISSGNETPVPEYYSISTEIGFTSFYGDIDDGPANGGILSNNLAFKIQAGRNFQRLFALKAQVSIGNLSGKKNVSTQSPAYYYFKTKFIEYTFTGGFNLIAFFSKAYTGKFNLYAEAGIGLIDIHSKLYNGENDSVMKAYGGGSQKATTEFTIPLGLFALYHVSKHSAISLHLTLSRVDTDKLDALEGNNNRDYYSLFSAGYQYKIYPNPNKSAHGNGLIKRKNK